MDLFFDLNMDILLLIQNLGEWLSPVMHFFTFLGNEEFYLLLMPILYWCIDVRIGIQVGFLLLFSNAVNALLKLGFHGPRPYWVSPQVESRSALHDFGFPSGHSQNAVAIWGALAYYLRKPWAWAAAVPVMILIGISRIYLGVHFPTDVLAGWFVGALLLGGFLALKKPFKAWITQKSAAFQISLGVFFSLLLILTGKLIQIRFATWSLPASWLKNAGESFDPFSLENITTVAGIFVGLGSGVVLMEKRGQFRAEGSWSQKMIRYGLGLVGVLLIWAGLDQVFPEGTSLIALSLRYLRYALVGAWISMGAPLLFRALKLAPPAVESS